MYGGKKIKALRLELELSQEEFANAIGVSQPYYSAIERGKKQITNKIIATIQEKFGKNREWLMGKSTEDTAFNDRGSDGGLSGGLNENDELFYTKFLKKLQTDILSNNKLADTIYNASYEENKVDFYYKHPDKRLDRLLSATANAFEEAFNNYATLVKVANYLGAPDFFAEKFSLNVDFQNYKNKNKDSFTEMNELVNDKKLLKCLQLIDYEDEVEHWNNQTHKLIEYMDRYKDWFERSASKL